MAITGDIIRQAGAAAVGKRTLEKLCTAVKAFQTFVEKHSGTPLSAITEAGQPHTWDEGRRDYHCWLLAHFVCYVNQTHMLVSTSLGYAKKVNVHWKVAFKHVLWTDDMFASLKPVTDGLKNMNLAVRQRREGLSAADICVLSAALRRRIGTVERPSWRGLYLYDDRLVETVIALWHFVYSEAYRYGDATCPDDGPFEAKFRLTRDGVKFSAPTSEGRQTVTLPCPRTKVTNWHTGFAMSSTVDDNAKINWGASLNRMIALDPTPTRADIAAETPLFRDVRNVPLGQGGGLPIKGRWMRSLIRSLVQENPGWFGDRVAKDFGIHAFRIGRLNDLLDAGASMFQVSSLGRWVSDSVLRYHRMSQEAAAALHAKALEASLTQDSTRGFVGHAVPRSTTQKRMLAEALTGGKPSARTSRQQQIAVSNPRTPGAPRQSTLDSWCTGQAMCRL